MRQDVFVDNNVAKNFCNPLDPAYKSFVKWLYDVGVLVTSVKLVKEYIASTGGSSSATNIAVIIDRLQREGRLNHFSNDELKRFRFPKRAKTRFLSNKKDHEHIKIVLMSDRRFAITLDDNLRADLNSFRKVTAVERPDDLDYANG